jgi:truncated hemoglobin YjbI
MTDTLWDRYGGYSFVAKAVDDFYARVLLSRNLTGYFKRIDMEQLIQHQIETIGAVMGGPYDLDVEALRRAHAHLAIKNDHFSEVAEILASTLDDNGLSLEDRNALMDVVASTRSVIVDSAELAA